MDTNPTTGNMALHLHGNAYLDLSGPGLSASYTKEAWIKFDPSRNFGYYHSIISGTATFPHMLEIKNDIVQAGHNAGWDTTEGIKDKTIIKVGEWVHLAVTYEWTTRTMTLYRNGLEVARSTTIPQVLQNESSNKTIQIGSYNNDLKFKGFIDEVRIWSYAREPEDIADYYDVKLPDSERTGLVYYLTLNAVDLSNHSLTTPVKLKNEGSGQKDIEINHPLGTADDFGPGVELMSIKAKALVTSDPQATQEAAGRIYVEVEDGYGNYVIEVYRRVKGGSTDTFLGTIPTHDYLPYQIPANEGDLITFKLIDDNQQDESFPGSLSPIKVNRLERIYPLAPKAKWEKRGQMTTIPEDEASNCSFDIFKITPGWIDQKGPEGGMREKIFRTLADQESDYDDNTEWGWKRHFSVNKIRRMHSGTIEKSFFSLTGLKEEFGFNVSGSGLTGGCPVGASLGLSSSKEKSYTQESVFTVSRSDYKSYEINLRPQYIQLTDEFKKAIAALPTPGKKFSIASEAKEQEQATWNAYDAFIQKWGTHYPRKVTYGGYLIGICTSTVNEMLETNITAAQIKGSIGGNDLLPGVSAEASNSITRTIHTKKGVKNFDLFYTGGAGNTVESWIVEDNKAQPISIELEYLDKLFNLDYFDPEDGVKTSILERKANFLRSMIEETMRNSVQKAPARPVVEVYELKPMEIKIVNCDCVDDSWSPSPTSISELRGEVTIGYGNFDSMAEETVPVSQDCTNCKGNSLKKEQYTDQLPVNTRIALDKNPRYVVVFPERDDRTKKGFSLSSKLYEDDPWKDDHIISHLDSKTAISTDKIDTNATIFDNTIATQGNAGWLIRVETVVRKLQAQDLKQQFMIS